MKTAVSFLILILFAGCVTKVMADPDSFTPVYDNLSDSMNWLRENTPENSTIFAWWDYAKTIDQLANRKPFITAPSKEILFTVAMYSQLSDSELDAVECPKCESHEKIKGAVTAFLSEDISTLIQTMKANEMEYILITDGERGKSYSLFLIMDMNPSEYLDENYVPLESANKFVLFKMWNGEELDGLALVYADKYSRIYKVTV